MNTHAPTAEEFLAQTEPDEDDLEAVMADWEASPGVLHVIPPDPMERIATALELMAEADKSQGKAINQAAAAADHSIAGVSMVPVTAHDALRDEMNERIQGYVEVLADLEDKHQTLTQVISDVEAALGKSKAAPALAAKAVIEAWKNPTVTEPIEDKVADAVGSALLTGKADLGDGVTVDFTVPHSEDSIAGHTRTPHESGPDFCRECSGELQEWITWPCAAVSGEAQPLQTGPEEGHEQPVQPERNAPVEEWREYARALGYAGPEIDKANRSVIRTTLGIAQPGTD